MSYIDIVFDGPPGHESGRFVEVEDATGKSINFGDWLDRGDGLWALRIERATDEQLQQLRTNIDQLVDEKHNLKTENAELKAANERLGEAVKALNLEKGELQRKLKAAEGMGIQQNQPEVFQNLKKEPRDG